MAGRRLDRVELISGMLLSVTALCSLMLALAAGTSAVAAFAGEQAVAQTAQGSLRLVKKAMRRSENGITIKDR